MVPTCPLKQNLWRGFFLLWFLTGMVCGAYAVADSVPGAFGKDTVRVYAFPINKEIGPAVWRITRISMEEAVRRKADLIIIEMNTYGGMVDAADSIRTRILNCSIPVYVFVNNNAISAGALISVAADKIYMRTGASLGAATVVNQTGAAMPDKYQSFMRSMMRSTAESHGKDTLVTHGDTLVRWKRDPLIAEAMVDPSTYIAGVIDTGKVLTLTAQEAIKYGYCEGIAESVPQILAMNGISNYQLDEFKLTGLEKMMGWLVNPYLQSILILLMLGGIYFEFQTPGVGFPLAVALTAAVVYFAPLYLEGLAEHWEILLFVVGLVLLALEIFVISGFGVAGIAGIICIVAGLTLSLIDNVVFSWDFGYAMTLLFKYLLMVTLSLTAGFIGVLWLAPKALGARWLKGVALVAEQRSGEGFVGVDDNAALIGRVGRVSRMLRPSGKVVIDELPYDAVAQYGYIDRGEMVKVIKVEAGQIYVVKV